MACLLIEASTTELSVVMDPQCQSEGFDGAVEVDCSQWDVFNCWDIDYESVIG